MLIFFLLLSVIGTLFQISLGNIIAAASEGASQVNAVSQSRKCGTNTTAIPKCKKPNEVYDPCDAPCPARRCDFDPTIVRCKSPPEVGEKDCVVGCRCIDNYVRNSEGVCIPREKCPPKQPTCGLNEVYNLCPDCSPQTCDTRNETFHCPYLPSNTSDPRCKPSCRCIKGFFRNNNGECVAATDCPPKQPTCGTNQVWDPCPDCSPQTCETMNATYNCRFIPANNTDPRCKPSCRCQKGFFRNKIGECISASECNECPGPHEYFSCGGACDNVCETIKEQNQTHCPIVNVVCNRMCYCEKGYARNKKKICIPIEDCPTSPANESDTDNTRKCVFPEDCTPKCKVNEVFSDCMNYGCGKQKCSDINKPIECDNPTQCESGCLCAPEFLRAENGICVPSEQCDPPPNCKVNEEFSKCGKDGCSKYYCSDLDLPPLCRDTFQCIPQCECKYGFLRAAFDNDTCVLEDECPRKCKANEQYSDCPSALCRPQTCKEAGFPVPCPIVGPDGQCSGEPGCICNSGYLRNNKGICIPDKECPSCGGDKNAVPGCGTHCGRTCATYNSSDHIICPLFCNLNGCDCREKYVYDGNLKKCVLPEKCTPTCQINEEFSKCANGINRIQNCADKEKENPCSSVLEESCTAGCVCMENFLRAKNGTCVPQDQCDEITIPPCDGK